MAKGKRLKLCACGRPATMLPETGEQKCLSCFVATGPSVMIAASWNGDLADVPTQFGYVLFDRDHFAPSTVRRAK